MSINNYNYGFTFCYPKNNNLKKIQRKENTKNDTNLYNFELNYYNFDSKNDKKSNIDVFV